MFARLVRRAATAFFLLLGGVLLLGGLLMLGSGVLQGPGVDAGAIEKGVTLFLGFGGALMGGVILACTLGLSLPAKRTTAGENAPRDTDGVARSRRRR
jgi:hypothetical protein